MPGARLTVEQRRTIERSYRIGLSQGQIASIIGMQDKGMSKQRAAKIANSEGASKRGGKSSGKGGNSSQGGTSAQKKKAGSKGGKASSGS